MPTRICETPVNLSHGHFTFSTVPAKSDSKPTKSRQPGNETAANYHHGRGILGRVKKIHLSDQHLNVKSGSISYFNRFIACVDKLFLSVIDFELMRNHLSTSRDGNVTLNSGSHEFLNGEHNILNWMIMHAIRDRSIAYRGFGYCNNSPIQGTN